MLEPHVLEHGEVEVTERGIVFQVKLEVPAVSEAAASKKYREVHI
jgi:hypothetical protein